jgi:hypothetical protein
MNRVLTSRRTARVMVLAAVVLAVAVLAAAETAAVVLVVVVLAAVAMAAAVMAALPMSLAPPAPFTPMLSAALLMLPGSPTWTAPTVSPQNNYRRFIKRRDRGLIKTPSRFNPDQP